MMGGLAEVLERFNRKERHLLIRDALGHKGVPLRLSEDFRQRMAEKLGIASGVPEGAWWATDYHIGWLAGALTAYVEGEDEALKARPNPLFHGRRLVEGNQEDVDLVFAWGTDLVMIEAKAYGAFSNKQMESKLQRLDLLHAHYAGLPHAVERPIRFHLLLISPRPPQKLDVVWPKWGYRGTDIPWIELKLDASAPVLTVTRCNPAGQSTAEGDHWRVAPN